MAEAVEPEALPPGTLVRGVHNLAVNANHPIQHMPNITPARAPSNNTSIQYPANLPVIGPWTRRIVEQQRQAQRQQEQQELQRSNRRNSNS